MNQCCRNVVVVAEECVCQRSLITDSSTSISILKSKMPSLTLVAALSHCCDNSRDLYLFFATLLVKPTARHTTIFWFSVPTILMSSWSSLLFFLQCQAHIISAMIHVHFWQLYAIGTSSEREKMQSENQVPTMELCAGKCQPVNRFIFPLVKDRIRFSFSSQGDGKKPRCNNIE